jgi:hypothetical protein
MSVRRVKAGTTDVSITIRIVDSTDGSPETAVTSATSGIDLWYRREGAAAVDLTESDLSALDDAHSDGGLLHIADGWYRLDLPDAACASGVSGVQIGGTVTGMVVLAPYIELPVNTAEDVYTRLGSPAGASVSADIATIDGNVDAILVDTGTTLDGKLDTIDANVDSILADTGTDGVIVASLGTQAKTDVNAEVADVLKTDTTGDPSQGAPPLNASMEDMINYLYREYVRNKVVVDTNSANQKQVYADDGTTILYEKDLSDSSSVLTVSEAATGA